MKTTERPPVKNVLVPSVKITQECPLCGDPAEDLFCSHLCTIISSYCTNLEDYLKSKSFNDERWVKVGLNSSDSAMQEVNEMFKTS